MTSVVLGLFLVVFVNLTNSATVHLYVGPHGLDSNSGLDHSNPLKTLDKARLKLDEHGIKDNTVIVELLPGYHDLTSTLHFKHGYSHPVTFRPYRRQEVHVTGGKRIDSSLFHHVTDHAEQQRLPQVSRSKVVKVHLPDAGITNYGQMSKFGFGTNREAPLELFINGNPTRFAQWPNQDFINVKSVPDGADGKRFTYSIKDNRDSKWAQENEPWAYGFWYWGWADVAVKVANLDVSNKTITLTKSPIFGMRIGHLHEIPLPGYLQQGGYFKVINMLCELDEPGEYYIDRSTGVLYVWPNTPSGSLGPSDVVYASLIKTCIKMDSGVKNLIFSDFTIEACRAEGLSATSVNNIKFQNMEIKNTGGHSLSFNGDSRYVTVSHCEIHHGDGGIIIKGGVRSTLIPSGNLIEDNHIWKYSRVGAVTQHGISCLGVQNTIRYNHIHDGQYTAIWWAGNDHVIEYNHVWNNCVNATDCGAIHAGRDWTNRGNMIRYNHIHHTLRLWPGTNTRGIMLDDQYSSVTIEHNVFYHNDIHVNVGGGRDNIIRYNVFYNATSSSIQIDGRGFPNGNGNNNELLTRLKNDIHVNVGGGRDNIIRSNVFYNATSSSLQIDGRGFPNGEHRDNYVLVTRLKNDIHVNVGGGRDNIIRSNVFYNATSSSLQIDGRGFPNGDHHNQTLQTKLKAVPYTSQLWKERYPKLAAMDQMNANAPEGNQVYNNIYYNKRGTQFDRVSSNINHRKYVDSHDNFKSRSATDFWSPENSDFRLRCLAVNWANGLNIPQPIGLDSVGPRQHTGPFHLHSGQHHPHHSSTNPPPCAGTVAPAINTPKTSYLSDGSGPNTIHPEISKHGCWFITTGCPNHPYNGTSRDTYGERLKNTGNDQDACLARAADHWKYCGSPSQYSVTVVFGPTGAMTVAGTGCFFADYGCPKHHISHDGGALYRDSYAESHGALHDERTCLARARDEWVYCGSDPDFPITSIYRPTGKTRTAGGGCWIQIKHCPADSKLDQTFFFDAWGATNMYTDSEESECFERATTYWRKCGSDQQYPVTAHFRPKASAHTVPGD